MTLVPCQGSNDACDLCQQDGGLLITQGPSWRLIRAHDENFPAFYRVVWLAHVAEFSELTPQDQVTLMQVVSMVERELRRALNPTKMNLASLGNVVPHLHWHVVARFDWDTHFPNPIWGAAQRSSCIERLAQLKAALPALDQTLTRACADAVMPSNGPSQVQS